MQRLDVLDEFQPSLSGRPMSTNTKSGFNLASVLHRFARRACLAAHRKIWFAIQQVSLTTRRISGWSSTRRILLRFTGSGLSCFGAIIRR
jgi:hypothetical protein